jgi:localization factor PodJL
MPMAIPAVAARSSGAAASAAKTTAAAPMPMPQESAPVAASGNPAPATAQDRRPIDPNLPPDHPLEPGSGGARGRSGTSPADRIAASEAALGPAKPPVIPDPAGKSNFIAAARRAAQAASREAASHTDNSAIGSDESNAAASKTGGLSKRIRSLLAGTGVVLLVLGSLQIAAHRFLPSDDLEGSAPDLATESTASNVAIPSDMTAATEPAPQTSPAAGRQSMLFPGTDSTPFTALPPGIMLPAEPTRPATNAAAPKSSRSTDVVDRTVTGSIQPPVSNPFATPGTAPLSLQPQSSARPSEADKLPPALGSTGLRAAAVKGDPAAEFEVALRFADGRGVPQDLTAAAEWFERAAKQGLVPAQFRLGGLYEKGMGVKKNLESARRLYLGAAEAGNAKAMHNLAVLFAEGIEGKPDYQNAAKWFRKAADHGVGDSQYNLGILYARGIGVEVNMAEAYKWFTLAARGGDNDAAKKRDDVGSRLDQQSLMAARAGAQVWTAQTQPDAAFQVNAPAGGWDNVATATTPKRRIGVRPEVTAPRPAQ